jgi:hypothetical protein
MGGEQMSQNYQQELENEVTELYRKHKLNKLKNTNNPSFAFF